jgi:hypothetical protein
MAINIMSALVYICNVGLVQEKRAEKEEKKGSAHLALKLNIYHGQLYMYQYIRPLSFASISLLYFSFLKIRFSIFPFLFFS